ncbi:hypothetical protein GCM10009628_25990 [Paeniglutamicibacter kerguelensis]|uniref:Transposase IS701-like DDE domain-containing protein n=1 Tax=Paeniglutamicibacter kerguelensis TaxID=254788 RepID=A0ABS4XB54_9MICC|nr:hypothetical protein [Paeniglutamicibacter kerguelensis]
MGSGLEEIRDLIGGEFARSEPRENAIGYIRGLLSDEERKNSWTLSERTGHGTPDGMQRLLSTTGWNPDAVRDALFTYVGRNLGDPAGILAIDETGFLKKGSAPAGVARQYSGTPDVRKAARSACSSPTPHRPGVPSWTGNSTCPRPGPRTRNAAHGPASPKTGPWPPSRCSQQT